MGSGALAAVGIPYIFLLPIAAYAGTISSTQTGNAGSLVGSQSGSLVTLVAGVMLGVFIIAMIASVIVGDTGLQAGASKLLLTVGGLLVFWGIISAMALPSLISWPTYGLLTYGILSIPEYLGIILVAAGGGI